MKPVVPQGAPPPVRLDLRVTPQVIESLDRLVATGLWGFTRADAAEELLRAALRDLGPKAPVPTNRAAGRSCPTRRGAR